MLTSCEREGFLPLPPLVILSLVILSPAEPEGRGRSPEVSRFLELPPLLLRLPPVPPESSLCREVWSKGSSNKHTTQALCYYAFLEVMMPYLVQLLTCFLVSNIFSAFLSFREYSCDSFRPKSLHSFTRNLRQSTFSGNFLWICL